MARAISALALSVVLLLLGCIFLVVADGPMLQWAAVVCTVVSIAGIVFASLAMPKPAPVPTLGATGRFLLGIGVRSDDPFIMATKSIVQQHVHTLALRRRQKLVADAYGVVDPTAWRNEMDYFITDVAWPYVNSTVGPHLMMKSTKKIFKQVMKRAPNADRADVLPAIARSMIETEIAAHDLVSASTQEDGYCTPAEFEHWCARQLVHAGWDAKPTGMSGDQGVDVRASRNGVVLVVQCKLYNQPVGNSAVQEAHAGKAFYRAHRAAVVSTAGFTPSARALASQTGVQLLTPDQLRTLS